MIQKTVSAAEKYGVEQKRETDMFNDIYNLIENTMINIENGVEEDDDEEPKDPTENWDKDKVDVKYDEDGKLVPVPKGFTPSNVDGEKKIDTGFVIKQDGTQNEFVWIPIVNGYTFGKLYNFGTSSSPKNEVITTTEEGYREPDILLDTTVGDASTQSGRGIELLKNVVGLSGSDDKILADWKTQLESEYARMKTSVSKYGGFYIGRYQTGFEGTEKATVRKNNAAENINQRTWYEMYQKSKKLAKDLSIESTMIWGCQWDAAMQWFLQSSNPDIVKYVRDSTGKGNYAGTQVGGNKVIPTGSNDNYKVNNIYDMAGNCWEWTLEAIGTGGRALRGGAYSFPETSTVSMRSGVLNSAQSTDLVSSRLTLIM